MYRILPRIWILWWTACSTCFACKNADIPRNCIKTCLSEIEVCSQRGGTWDLENIRCDDSSLPKETGKECLDGIDNDGDGLIDEKDPDCRDIIRDEVWDKVSCPRGENLGEYRCRFVKGDVIISGINKGKQQICRDYSTGANTNTYCIRNPDGGVYGIVSPDNSNLVASTASGKGVCCTPTY